MRNKKYLKFLVIVLILVVSMFSNVFANSLWTVTSQYNSHFSVGDSVWGAWNLALETSSGPNKNVEAQSSFEVKQGDVIRLSYGFRMYGINGTSIDGSASMVRVTVTTADGKRLLSVTHELKGNFPRIYDDVYATVPAGSEGKVKLYVGVEGTGTLNVYSEVYEMNFYVNDDEK